MLLIQPTARGWAHQGHRPRRALSGTNEDVLARLDTLKVKYGNGVSKDAIEQSEIMGLVIPYFKDDDWQYCTINAWLNGTPSEDDIDWKAKYFSEMPLLEEVCGDHSFFNQYDAAFDDLKSAGCPQAVIDWIRLKGQAAFSLKRKGAKAEQEGAVQFDKAVGAAKNALNPFSPSSPLFWGLLAVGAVLVLKFKK